MKTRGRLRIQRGGNMSLLPPTILQNIKNRVLMGGDSVVPNINTVLSYGETNPDAFGADTEGFDMSSQLGSDLGSDLGDSTMYEISEEDGFFTRIIKNIEWFYETYPKISYMILAGILIGFVFLAMFLIRKFWPGQKHEVLLFPDGYILRENHMIVQQKDVPARDTDSHGTYFMWLNIKDFKYNFPRVKSIMIHGDINKFTGLLLMDNINDLAFIAGSMKKYDGIMIEDIPIKKWVSIAIVIQEKMVSVYINGRLESTIELSLVPTITGDIMIGNPEHGMDGVMTAFRYFTRDLSLSEIQSLHNNGPWGSNILERLYYNYFGKRTESILYLEENIVPTSKGSSEKESAKASAKPTQ